MFDPQQPRRLDPSYLTMSLTLSAVKSNISQPYFTAC